MKILLNVKAVLELKEKTELFNEFGKYLPCVIKTLEPVYVGEENRQFFGGRSQVQVLVIEDSYGEEYKIPFEDVENVRY